MWYPVNLFRLPRVDIETRVPRSRSMHLYTTTTPHELHDVIDGLEILILGARHGDASS